MANAMQTRESGSGNGLSNDDVRRAAEQRRTGRERQKQILNLQRENILSQKTSHPARRAALEAALAEIEAQIQAIG
ncbi:MAG: hypothetical protein KGL37_09875 [Acidobacteriota bacterium]|nr:hypothetical protein [Acidobacteriota bacterium]